MKEAIILAGGLGSRLRTVISDVPKPMSPICGIPFLEILLRQLSLFGFTKVILSVGYKYEIIQNYFGPSFGAIQLDYCVESSPLGTGGAIAQSLLQANTDDILIVNGDSVLLLSLEYFHKFHANRKQPAISIALKAEKNFDRYGAVVLDEELIVRFNEKQYVSEGVFNAGLYWLNVPSIKNYLNSFPVPFSFEKEVFEKQVVPLYGCVFNDYFIDIGIPSDYERAQTELLPSFDQYAEQYIR